MATAVRVLRGGASTAYPAEFQILLDDWKFAEPAAKDVIDSCSEICKEYTSGLNRYEKIADSFASYAMKMPDVSARESIMSSKPLLEEIGRLHRQFAKDVQENVIAGLQTFLNGEYKAMTAEVSKLNRLRTAYDNAADAYRRKPNEAGVEEKKNTTEAAHDAQVAVVKETLAPLEAYWDMMADSLTKFDELYFKLLDDEKEEMEKLIAANKC